MRKSGRAGVGGIVGVAAMLTVGAPLLAQSGRDAMGHDARAGAAEERREAREARGAALQARRDARGTLVASLLGRNEVSPATGRRGAGDMDGTGGATVVIRGEQLCFAVAVAGIGAPNGLHIHRGRAGRNGDVVVPLTAPAAGDPGASAGCVAVGAALAAAIQRRPRAFYVNVHTGEFPAGALRGQLRKLPPAR